MHRTGKALDDRDLHVEGRSDQLAATADDARSTGPLIAVAATAATLGVAWIVYRIAKASVKRHPAVRVAHAGLHAVRNQRPDD